MCPDTLGDCPVLAGSSMFTHPLHCGLLSFFLGIHPRGCLHPYPHPITSGSHFIPDTDVRRWPLLLEIRQQKPRITYGPVWSNPTDMNAHESTLSYTSKKANAMIQFYGTHHSISGPTPQLTLISLLGCTQERLCGFLVPLEELKTGISPFLAIPLAIDAFPPLPPR